MTIILFRPFDFGKWCAIGLSAFLAGLLEGGNGFNASYNNSNGFNNNSITHGGNFQLPKFDIHTFNSGVSQAVAGLQIGVIVALVLLIFLFVFAFILLFLWLGTRGEFMILDNMVRNRGAISWPWHNYARQANSLFVFYLLIMVIFLTILVPIIVALVLLSVPLLREHRWPVGGEIIGYVLLGLVYLVFAVVVNFIIFVYREFGIPLMFRNGLLARPAFFAAMNLIRQHTASVVVFVLLRIAIYIGVAILSLILCCATCCIEMLPYVGTVMLLPAIIYVRCFTLDCLAQFGPEYDVWTVDVPPAGAAPVSPLSPPPPPG